MVIGSSVIILALAFWAGTVSAAGRPVVSWDFTDKATPLWTGNAAVTNLVRTEQGLACDLKDGGPCLVSPPVTFALGQPLLVRVRVRRTTGEYMRLFWSDAHFRRINSVVSFFPNDGALHDVTFGVPALAGTNRFQLELRSTSGHLAIERITVETRHSAPVLPVSAPVPVIIDKTNTYTLFSGALQIRHSGTCWGAFSLYADGTRMADGHEADYLVFEREGVPEVLFLSNTTFRALVTSTSLVEEAIVVDNLGGEWTCRRVFRKNARAGSLDVHIELVCDQARRLIHFPWITLFPGLGTFGTEKTQAVVPGVEYLANEPGSSDADIKNKGRFRRIPAPHKLAYPLAALSHNGRYVGLTWKLSRYAALVFDSPDQVFNSGSHVMALWFPNVGDSREENSLFAHDSLEVAAGVPVSLSATIMAGEGQTIVPAIQQYIDLNGLPDLPAFSWGITNTTELLARGWLDSAVSDGEGGWDHANWGGEKQKGHTAADACAYVAWLAEYCPEAALRERLLGILKKGVTLVREKDPSFSSGVSHIRMPTAAFLFDAVEPFLKNKADNPPEFRDAFNADGVRVYHVNKGKPDYRATHFADHANGYGAAELVNRLERALYMCDPEYTRRCIELLDKQTALYQGTVPRGAQTWEIPLHTPDILAAAHLVRQYVLGYELTGRADLLEEARYWAWTGLAFVYLNPWKSYDQNMYATVAVMGATSWEWPIWIGRPVQWCGLVYADAIARLAQYDLSGPWEKLSRGITNCGLFHVWPKGSGDLTGLLADSIGADLPDDHWTPAINPGTVQTGVPALFGKPKSYDYHVSLASGWVVHAPCALVIVEDSKDGLRFETAGFGNLPYHAAILGMRNEPDTTITKNQSDANATTVYDATNNWLIIKNLKGPCSINCMVRQQQKNNIEQERR